MAIYVGLMEPASLNPDTADLPQLIWLAHLSFEMGSQSALNEAGYEDLPANSIYLLGMLASRGSTIRQKVLADHLGISKQAVGQLIDRLAKRKYVSKKVSDTDRRQVLVALRPRGRAAAALVIQARESMAVRLVKYVGPEELRATREVLKLLLALRLEGQFVLT